MARSFSFDPEKERERESLASDVKRFLDEGGEIQKTPLPSIFPTPRPPHASLFRVASGNSGRTVYVRTDGGGIVED